MEKDEIIEHLKSGNLTVEKVIDAIIDVNAIIGVGLIDLAQTLYLYTILNSQLRREGITKEEVQKIIADYKQKHYSNPLN